MATPDSLQATLDSLENDYNQLIARSQATQNPAERANIMAMADQVKMRARTAAETGQVIGASDAIRFPLQGASFGLSDEIEAGLRASAKNVAGLFTDRYDDSTYGSEKQAIEQQMDLSRQAYPGETTALELGGAAFGPGLIMRGITKGATTLPNLLGRTIAGGAAEGGLAGAGYSRESPTENPLGFATDVGIGAGFGSVVAPAVGVVAPGVATVANRAASKLRQNASSRADQIVGEIMNRTGWTATTARAKLDELGPEATLADLDNALLDWTSVAIGRSDDAANRAGYYVTRQAGAKDRMVGALEDATGESVGSFQQTQPALAAERKATANQLYGAEGIRYQTIPTDTIGDLLETPQGAKAYKIALDNWRGRERLPKDWVPDEGELPVGLVDDFQRILGKEGTRVQRGQKSGTEDVYFGLQGDVTQAVDQQVPAYPLARAAYAETSGLIDAGATGRGLSPKASGMTMDAIEKEVAAMTPEQQRMFRQGWLENAYDTVMRGGGAKGTGYVGSGFGPESIRNRQFEMASRPGKQEVIPERLATEATYSDTLGYLNPHMNSRTAPRAAAEARADRSSGLRGILADVIPADVQGVANVLKNAGGISDEAAMELGKRLMDPKVTAADLQRMISTGQLKPDLLSTIRRAGFKIPALSAVTTTQGASYLESLMNEARGG